MATSETVTCSTCDDYRLVDGPDEILIPCPDCRPDTPIGYARCTVHGQIVSTHSDGRLAGKCWSCTREAANAIARIERRT